MKALALCILLKLCFLLVPINGNWGPWERWSTCSVSCDQGQRVRTRKCNDPAPKFNGRPCEGAASSEESCKLKSCNLGNAIFFI